MASGTLKIKQSNTRTFIPKMSNFKTSSRYEGLFLKKENIGKSISYMKLKYAR